MWADMWQVPLTHLAPDYSFSNYNKAEGQTYLGYVRTKNTHCCTDWKGSNTICCSLQTNSSVPEGIKRRLRSVQLTGVEEDHGFQTDVLLPLKLQLTKSRSGCQQHVENLHDALHTLSLLPAETQRKGVKQRKWEKGKSERWDKKKERLRGKREGEEKGTKTCKERTCALEITQL